MDEQRSQSKTSKKQKNLYLSAQARQLLALLARNAGISETAIVELLIREKAARDKITLPEEAVAGTSHSTPKRRRRADDGSRRDSTGDASHQH